MGVDEHTIEVAGMPVFYRSAPVADGATGADAAPGAHGASGASSATRADSSTPLYLHGIPTSSDDWTPVLERTGGIAPDLIGFGRSAKAAHLDYTLAGEAVFLERLLDQLGIQRVRLVAHDWGAAGALVFAQQHPERVERLVLCNALPLLDGFTWQRIARLLRRPGVGELIMGSTPRWLLARTLRQGCVHPETFSDHRVRAVWDQFDQGTQRAVLRLFRATSERDLAAAGAMLETLRMPALVIWGEQDPWLPVELAESYGERLPAAEVTRIAGAGHWPWLDEQDALEQIADFVQA